MNDLSELLQSATLSASGTDVTILCSDHDTRDAIFEALEKCGDIERKLSAAMEAIDTVLAGLHKDDDIRAILEPIAKGFRATQRC